MHQNLNFEKLYSFENGKTKKEQTVNFKIVNETITDNHLTIANSFADNLNNLKSE